MKTRNIIAVLSIICTMIMTSCSADSVLDEMGSQNVPTSSEVFTLAFNAHMGTTTRAAVVGTENPKQGVEDLVNNPIFFLVNGTKVLDAANAGDSIFTKSQSGMKVIAVACASATLRNELKGMKNTDAIYNKVLDEAHLNSFIKVGEEVVNFSNVNAYGKVTVDVTVNQVAARIDLSSLIIKKNHADNVTLKSATLINRQLNGKLQGAVLTANESYGDAGSVTINKTEVTTDTTIGYTFANAAGASKEVTLKLIFNVDNEDVPVLVPIKHDGTIKVEAGFIYKLKLTATITGKNVIPTIDFEVAAWKKTSINADMEEI